MTRPRDIAESFVAAIARHDPDAVAACFAEDYEDKAPARQGEVVRGRDEVRANFARMFASMPNINATIIQLAEREDEVWMEWRMSGTRDDGTTMDFVGVNIFGAADGTFRWGRIYTELARSAGGIEAQIARMRGTRRRPRGTSALLRRAEVGGLSVAYQRAGDGPPLVLLHGFTHDSRAWRPQLEGLADQFTVIAWDAPGAGQSPDPPETFGIGDWADCLAGFLDAVDVTSAHIVGLSWGGLLAQEFYRRHPARVRSLVLADTYAGWKGSLPEPIPEERLAACLRDASLPPAEFVGRYLPGMFSQSPGADVRDEMGRIMADFHPLGFRLMATALARADTRDLLPNVRVPTLLIWGDADARSPMGVAHQLHEAIPGARFAVIPGAGHVANLEDPIRFNTQVRDFCLSVSIR